MFKKILISNRGEIALRVIRSCKEMGIKTVCFLSFLDEHSLPGQFCDEKIICQSENPQDAYLNIKEIIAAAKKSGAEAIHPGYGFLAENENFVRACENEKIIFIGPSSETLKLLGDKVMAKNVALKNNVPVIKGTEENISLSNLQLAKNIIKKIGYPVLLKASFGGGGRGMRKVENENELEQTFISASREVKGAFVKDDIFIEKYLEKPRHIEVQILADGKGEVINLGERECSIQRKHQKLIEEAPGPIVTEKDREKITSYAVKIAKACNYKGAGTVEFLRDNNGNFYFLEVNPRVQVEHPITEMITGVDIVEQQINIACYGKLSYKQQHIKLKGHAIECRINAEDPYNNFGPSPGEILNCNFPGGNGVRIDTAIFNNYLVPVVYDSLVAKLIIYAPTRKAAIKKMLQALKEFKIKGIKTTIPFYKEIFKDENFIKGNFTTNFLEENNYLFKAKEISEKELVAAFSAIFFKDEKLKVKENKTLNKWKYFARLSNLK